MVMCSGMHDDGSLVIASMLMLLITAYRFSQRLQSMANSVMPHSANAHSVMTFTVMAYVLMAHSVMTFTVMAYIVMAHSVMTFTVKAYTVMAHSVPTLPTSSQTQAAEGVRGFRPEEGRRWQYSADACCHTHRCAWSA